MATRAWTVWGVGAALVGGLAVSAKPPGLPGNPQVDGKVPPPLTQDHHQVEVSPPPRLLPPSVLDPKPLHGPATASGNVIGLNASQVQLPDLDTPIRATGQGRSVPPFPARQPRPADWMTVVAFARAESHFDACEMGDARRWYEAVIKRAPGSRYAVVAKERLVFGKVIPAGMTQTREPPLTDPAGAPKPIPRTANGPID
jgi:hypothetical protein